MAFGNIGDPVKKVEYDSMMGPLYNGYVPVRVEEDGNCLFHSFAYLSGESYVDLRRKTVEWITENAASDPLIPFYAHGLDLPEHLRRMSEDKEWGTDLEIYALSKLLNVKTVLYDVTEPFDAFNPVGEPFDAFNPVGPTEQYTLLLFYMFDEKRAHFAPLAEEGQVERQNELGVVEKRRKLEMELTGQSSQSNGTGDDSWRIPRPATKFKEATLDEMITGLDDLRRDSPDADAANVLKSDADNLRKLKEALGGEQ